MNLKNPPIHSEPYVPDNRFSHSVPIPSEIGITPAGAKRQNYLVKKVNEVMGGNLHLIKDGATTSNFLGNIVVAIDTEEKVVFITCDDFDYLNRPHVQKLCQQYDPEWILLAWVGEKSVVVPLVPKSFLQTDVVYTDTKSSNGNLSEERMIELITLIKLKFKKYIGSVPDDKWCRDLVYRIKQGGVYFWPNSNEQFCL